MPVKSTVEQINALEETISGIMFQLTTFCTQTTRYACLFLKHLLPLDILGPIHYLSLKVEHLEIMIATTSSVDRKAEAIWL